MYLNEIHEKMIDFRTKLEKIKKGENIKWYPYEILSGIDHINNMLTNENRGIFSTITNKHIADIGTADGDMGYFFESMGYDVDLIDCEPPNYNKMQGVRKLKELLNSNADIYNIDLDSQFKLPKKNYELIIFMGILYHLKNPFYVLEQLAYSSKYLILSTKIAKFTPDNSVCYKDFPMAYLVGAEESANGDSTNYWIFSENGLRRILQRTHWDILDLMTVGDTKKSDPITTEHDERAFCLLKSRCFE